MRTVALYESLFTTLDGSGNGTVRIAVDEPRAIWRPDVASVSVSTAVNEIGRAHV